jgi:NTE family protein
MSADPAPVTPPSPGGQLPRPVAFVLSGGASFGAVQVGMLQALAEIELAPDLVIGTSVGAINGALLAQDPRGAANRLSHRWLQVTRDMVFPGGVMDRLRALHHHRSLVPSDGLADLIAGVVSAQRIEDLALPFAATATDLVSGAAVHLQTGPLVPALLASAAIPGLFAPVRIGGRDLVDGGVVSNVPVDQALRMRARSVVVLDCGVYGLRAETPRTLPETIAHVVAVMLRQQLVRDLPPVARQVPVLYLPGPFPMTSSPLEFTRSAWLMQEAYDKARAFLKVTEPAGPGLYGRPPLVADRRQQ